MQSSAIISENYRFRGHIFQAAFWVNKIDLSRKTDTLIVLRYFQIWAYQGLEIFIG